MKVTERIWLPAPGTVPATGEYANVPDSDVPPAPVAAALSCVELSAVPNAIGAGVAQAIVGVAWPTDKVTVLVAVV